MINVHDQDARDDDREPDQYTAALTDFGPGRSKIFGNSADDDLKVYDQGPGHADVKEGSGGVWERLSYDWTDPNHLVASTTDSNTWGGPPVTRTGSRATPMAPPTSTTSSCAKARTSKGKFLGVVLGSVGKSKLVKAFQNSVKAVEAQAYPAEALQP